MAGRPKKTFTDAQIIEFAIGYLNCSREDKPGYLKSIGISQPTLWRLRQEIKEKGIEIKAEHKVV